MDSHLPCRDCRPSEEFSAGAARGADRWHPEQKIEALKAKAKGEGLWNLCRLPPSQHDSEEYFGRV